MCTLLIARNLFRFYPLVVAANRDERLRRPSSPPRIWDGNPSMLAPVDEVFGGTWIGVNASGVVAAVTNRPAIPHVHGKTLSRGHLVPMALEGRTATEALERVVSTDGSLFNGFHLAIADSETAFMALGDGARITGTAMPDGLTVVTEEGWGPEHSARALRIEVVFRNQVGGHPPRPSTFAPLLHMHDRRGEAAGESGTCLHGSPEDEWVTKSSALARVQDHKRDDGTVRRYWEFFHKERPADGIPNCDGRWSLHEMDLA